MADLRIDEDRLHATIMSGVSAFAQSFAESAARRAVERSPVRTGDLRSSIRVDPIRRTGPWSVSTGISVHSDYAAAVHEGTRPHVIRARRAQALRFEMGGRVIFARSVRHPGNRGNPFLADAVRETVAAEPRIH